MSSIAAETASDISKIKGLRFTEIVILIAMFVVGFCGLVYEYLLSSVATNILGNSLEQFALIIALMFAAMGIGGWVQKFLSDKYLVEKFCAIQILLALIGGYSAIALYASYGFLQEHFLLIQYGYPVLIGVLVGLEVPLAIRILQGGKPTLKSVLGSVYFFDYAGGFIGALIWVYVMLRSGRPYPELGLILGGLNLTVAIIMISYFRYEKSLRFMPAFVLAVIAVGTVLGIGYSQNRDWSNLIQQRLYKNPIVFSKTTRYQHLVMTYDARIKEHRFFINGNPQFASTDEFIYHESLVHPAMAVAKKHDNVLILGGGDGLALREVLKYKDVQTVTLVDLDPEMTSFCTTNETMRALNNGSFGDARVTTLGDYMREEGAILNGDPKPVYLETGEFDKTGKAEVQYVAGVRVINFDADKFVEKVKGTWDVIIIDFPDPNSVEVAKLYSKEFYMKLMGRATEETVVVVQSTSPFNAKETFLCIQRTIRAAGFTTVPYHDNVPTFGDWGWNLAWVGNRTEDDVKAKLSSLQSFAVETKYLTPNQALANFSFGKNILYSTNTDVNEAMNPVIVGYYYLDSWQIE